MFINQRARADLHLDLEMTGKEYLNIIESDKKNKEVKESSLNPDELAQLQKHLEYGKRNLQWIDIINAGRSVNQKISLTSAATTLGYPISNPRILNFKVIVDEWSGLQELLPLELRKVIFENGELTEKAPLTDREMVEWLVQVDRAYQNSARFVLLMANRESFEAAKARDVRGYLQIKNNPDVDNQLKNWSHLDEVNRALLKKALIRICYNTITDDNYCLDLFEDYRTRDSLLDFKNLFILRAKVVYNSFFDIPVHRNDFVWTNENVLQFPFSNPKNEQVFQFLKFNIEDEFRWKDWSLNLNFVDTYSPNTTHVVFVPGSIARVNGIAGSEITMDANSLLSEYDMQWTIRHEYGHVLGFRDCYIEFYDPELSSFVSYQLDVTNLMCSRRGHFKQIHYDELMRVYRDSK